MFKPFRLRIAMIGISLSLIVCACSQARAADEIDPLSFDRKISDLFRRYCYKCHNDDDANGDVNLAKDNNLRLILDNALVWQTALDRVDANEMPPEDAKQPSKEERELILKFLRVTLAEINCEGQKDPGKPLIRRLNRTEYNNSIRYLTGLDLNLADSFPADTTSYGFDNIAESLTLTPLQVEQYYTAAQQVVESLRNDKQTESRGAYRAVFYVDANKAGSERDAARLIMQRFADRAFRRPVEPDWIEKLLLIYDRAREQQQEHEAAIGNMIVAVLISPRFLMRAESPKPDTDEPFPIDDFDLASRLSFFLWSGPPDEVLYELASHQELSKPSQLDRQIERMLADQRSDALIKNFFAPWLQFDEVESHQPDEKVFPNYNAKLREAIVAEPRLILAEMIRKNRSITDLIDANYTYANEALAAHYGISDVRGETMQRIELLDRRRGGLLTSAALLMAQADPGRTNVPRRGNFVAGTILGTPAPPPPPNVPELPEPKSADKPLTLRERLDAHRSNPSCAACHAKIDPLGFGLENYDAIGAWREQEVGKSIDASGELPDGRQFNGPIELKNILLERKEQFAETFTKKLLIYALGRGPIYADQCVVADAVIAAKENDYRLSTIIQSIVHSYPFLHRRNPEY